jgi:cytochrome b
MSNVQCTIASVMVVALMVGVSVVRTRWGSIGPALASYFSFSNAPRRVSGD